MRRFLKEAKMSENLDMLIQAAVLQDVNSAHEIARGLGKPYSTLLRECNPYDKGAKFGAKTLLDLMIFTGNIEPLRFMANILGYEVVKRGKDAGGNGE